MALRTRSRCTLPLLLLPYEPRKDTRNSLCTFIHLFSCAHDNPIAMSLFTSVSHLRWICKEFWVTFSVTFHFFSTAVRSLIFLPVLKGTGVCSCSSFTSWSKRHVFQTVVLRCFLYSWQTVSSACSLMDLNFDITFQHVNTEYQDTTVLICWTFLVQTFTCIYFLGSTISELILFHILYAFYFAGCSL